MDVFIGHLTKSVKRKTVEQLVFPVWNSLQGVLPAGPIPALVNEICLLAGKKIFRCLLRSEVHISPYTP
jgi:hypothetical protein